VWHYAIIRTESNRRTKKMDESEVAVAIQDFANDTLGDASYADADGCTAFYLIVGPKQFKVMVQECGEDI
jgi:hypothetical protein